MTPCPLVIFFDEIDALKGDALISVLRQLRGGFADRPRGFPHSVGRAIAASRFVCCRTRAPRSAPRPWRPAESVAVVVRLVGALDGHAEVLRLLGRESRQLHPELLQV